MSGGGPLIGILGATGAVGVTAAHRIASAGLGRIRLGGRSRERLAKLADAVAGPAETIPVDLTDPDRLAEFCAGCRIVVNCAGPTYRILDTVARAAFAAGADHVDIGGELAARDAITGTAGRAPAAELDTRTAVFSAGVMPGLSGLLPRLLTGRPEAHPLRRLDLYVGGAAMFTALSAVDALLTRGPRFGVPMAALKDGAVAHNALAPLQAVHLPEFPRPMDAWPYLTTEAQTLAKDAGVRECRSYNVFPSNRVPEVLAAAWAGLDAEGAALAQADGLEPHAAAVVEASRRDNAECGAFYVMLFTARPMPGGKGGPSRVVLKATDSYALSGVVMTIAAEQVLSGHVPPGAHLAAEALDPERAAIRLRMDPLVTSFSVV